MTHNETWQVGQKAIINRQTVVTIERVTPSGRVVAGGRTFDVNGMERSSGYRRDRLELLTPEIQAEIDLVSRGVNAFIIARSTLDAADRWLRESLSAWNRKIPKASDVEKAERLTAAIKQVMESEKEVAT